MQNNNARQSEAETHALIDSLPRVLNGVPTWLDPAADTWNVAPLHRRTDVKIWTLDFGRISHEELRDIARKHALWQIVERRVGPRSLTASLDAFVSIGAELKGRPASTLKTEDIYAAEANLRGRHGPGTFVRRCASLQYIGQWLSRHTQLRLDYTSRHRAKDIHGRASTDTQREKKLLSDTVISNLLAARNRKGISERDQFFLSAVAISATTGFRIGELLTLPVDCLLYDQKALLVRNFVSKSGKSAPRAVPSELADITIDAVDHIRRITESARAEAASQILNPPTDWTALIAEKDPAPFVYFANRWLAEWTNDPENRLIDDRWSYFSFGDQSKWIPIADMIEAHDGNVSAIARDTGLSRPSIDRLISQLEASRRGEFFLGTKTSNSRRAFDTDRRFPSVEAFRAATGFDLKRSPKNSLLTQLIDEARSAQLALAPFSPPERDEKIEAEYSVRPDVISDPETGSGILKLDGALFVLFKNQLSLSHRVDRHRIVAVSISQFNHWLTGYARDRGTRGHGDSVCARLNILDPLTDEPAQFTNHSFRHWLETAYESGGLSQTQISTLFNRKSTSSNSVYDHTSSETRRDRIKEALADGQIIGHAAQAYNQIAKESQEEAAEYLETATKFQNPMPHGICRLNWALEPCPHALSCFSCEDEQNGDSALCTHLIVDTENSTEIDEIERIHRNACSIKRIMEDDGAESSPQYIQFDRVARSTQTILKKAGRA